MGTSDFVTVHAEFVKGRDVDTVVVHDNGKIKGKGKFKGHDK